MAQHHHFHHRRAGLHAEAAQLEPRKRTPVANPVAEADAQTFVSVVYTTAAPTFNGPVAGYTTLGPVVPTPNMFSQPTQAASSSDDTSNSGLLDHDPNPPSQQKSASVGSPVSVAAPSSSQGSAPSAAPSSNVVAPSSSGTPFPGPASATSSAAPSKSAVPSSGGTSGGAKAGIAFAVLLVIAGLAALGFFLYRKKQNEKNAAYKKAFDEKHNVRQAEGPGMSAFGAGAQRSQSVRTMDAPRLEVRPASKFEPNLPGSRKSSGNPMAMALGPNGGAGLQTQRNAPNDPANPFGNHAETLAPGVIPAAGGPAPRPITRFPSAAGNADPVSRAMAGVGPSAIVAAGAANNTEKPANGPANPASEALAQPPAIRAVSPTASEYSHTEAPASPPKGPGAVMAGAAMAGAAGAAAGGANGATPVHRVQLDFKPSMDDELGLQAGQLVRLLHEYDDGWALCIRLDRSQQGVCPRTCLSTRPVKPRPNNGPSNGPRGPPPPGMRGPPPHMQQPGRPMSPANNGRNSPGPRMRGPPPNGRQSPSPYGGPPQGRPMSPSYGFPPAPRPLSPGGRPAQGRPQQGGRSRNSSDPYARGGRPMSPSGNRPRSNSGSNLVQGGRQGPGPSRMNPNASGSPPMNTSPRPPHQLEQVPMVLRNVGGGQPQYAGGPGPNSPPQQPQAQPPKTVARKPAPGQAM